jgi:hypothetical protein
MLLSKALKMSKTKSNRIRNTAWYSGNIEADGKIDKDTYYKSTYHSSINPQKSKKGTCNYCLRCNGRIFKGSDLILSNGEFGHHPNCKCSFTPVEKAVKVKNGFVTNKDYGARKTLDARSLKALPISQLGTIARKRGFENKIADKGSIMKYIKNSRY